jgi:hypothetical protein
VDARVFLIHLFKLLIEALSKNAVSQRTPSKILAEILEEAKADTLGRLEKHPSDCGPDIQAEETKKHIESTPFHLKSFYPSNWRKISLPKEMSFIDLVYELTTFNVYKLTIFNWHRYIEDTPHQFYKDFRAFDELLSFWDMYEVQARQAVREIKTGYDTIITLDSLSLYNDRENSATITPLPGREDGTSHKEWEPQHRVDTAKPQALKELEDSVEEKLKSSEDTTDVINIPLSVAVSLAPDINKASQKGVSLEEIKQALQQKAQALSKKGEIFSHQPKQEKALQPPDLSEIPLYRGHRGRRRQDSPPEVRPLDFLETHYGQWLSVFGAEENRVYQDQIRGHDRKLIEGVKNQLRAEGKGRKVSDIVKTRSARVDRELENVSVEDLKRKPQLAGTLYSREKRAADKAKAPSRSRSRNS